MFNTFGMNIELCPDKFKIHFRIARAREWKGSIDDGDPRAKTSHKGKISARSTVGGARV